jgi:hypothetical protein
MGDSERDDRVGRGGGYGWRDWQNDGFRGRPPWRRGYRPWSLLLSIVLVAVLATIFVVAGSRVH